MAAAHVLAATILALAGIVLATTPDRVTLPTGVIEGVRREHSRFFKGVPYAAPPIGNLRWRPPQAHAPWDGVWDATDFRESCLQGAFDPPITNQSESCLYLNIYAPLPPSDPETRFPVMVWVHGGSYTGGSSNESRLNGTWTVEHFQNVIIVTINYRLNVFGFLGSALLANRSDSGSFGNYGIQDQRMALQWVAANIALFHGDPTRVTLYGESAGAGSVAVQFTTAPTWPFFQRAIMESGGFSLWNTQDRESAQGAYEKVLAAVGCGTIACLEGTDARRLLNASYLITPRCKQAIAWSPVVDGVELMAPPWALAQQGHHAQVPVIIGTNRDEGASFVPLKPNVNEAQYDAWLDSNYGALAATLKQLYPPSDYPRLPCCTSFFLAAEHISGDFSMTCPTRRAARWLSRTQPNTFLYMFVKDPAPLPVALHACEIPFVFMARNLLYSPNDVVTSTNMGTLWNRFAVSTDPNTPINPAHTLAHSSVRDADPLLQAGAMVWPAYNASSDVNLFINVALSTGTGLRRAQCDFWDTMLADKCF